MCGFLWKVMMLTVKRYGSTKTNDIKKTESFQSFEHLELLLKSNGKWARLIILYRPPPSVKNKLNVGACMADFTVLLEGLSISTGELVLMGDFNFHVENHENDQHAQQLLSLIDAFGLIQHVRQPTHLRGHTHDW